LVKRDVLQLHHRLLYYLMVYLCLVEYTHQLEFLKQVHQHPTYSLVANTIERVDLSENEQEGVIADEGVSLAECMLFPLYEFLYLYELNELVMRGREGEC